MGYFSELEVDVLDLYCAEVPVEEIAKDLGISVELVEKIGRKWEQDNDSSVMDYA
jgi:FixJ family two-component response regulator